MIDLRYPTEPNKPDEPTDFPSLVEAIRREFLELYHWEDDPYAVEGVETAYWHMKQRIDDLKDYFPPNGQLPGNGQRLWQEIQSSVDSFRQDNQRPFFNALNDWLAWVISTELVQSQLHDTLTDKARPGESLTTSGESSQIVDTSSTPMVAEPWKMNVNGGDSDEAMDVRLAAFLRDEHQPSPNAWVGLPLTQKEIAKRLNTYQPAISRAFKKLWGENAWRRYVASFSLGKRPGYVKVGKDGSRDTDGIV